MIDRLFLIGFDHKTTPRTLREKVAAAELAAGDFRRLLQREVPDAAAEHSVAVLATCHRTEMYGVAPDAAGAIAAVLRHLSAVLHVSEGILRQSTRIHVGREAVRHLFEVAAGMHSVVRGESQILGQIKETLAKALEQKTSGAVLNTLLRAAIESGKRVRTHAPVGVASASLADMALRFLNAEERRLLAPALEEGPEPVVVGSGRMAAIVVSRLYRLGCRRLTVVSSDPQAAERLVIGNLQIRVVPRAALFDTLRATRIAFFCNRSPRPLLRREDQGRVHPQSGERRVLIDLAHPRAVDWDDAPAGVRLINLATLEALGGSQPLTDIQADAANALVQERVEAFVDWCHERTAVPHIGRVKEAIDEAAEEALAEALQGLSPADATTAAALTRQMRRLAGRASHLAIVALKEQARLQAFLGEQSWEAAEHADDLNVAVLPALSEAVAQ